MCSQLNTKGVRNKMIYFATIKICLPLLRNGFFIPTKLICRISKNIRKITIRIANLNDLALPPPKKKTKRRHYLLTVSSFLDKTHAFMPLMSKQPLLCNSTIIAVLRSIRRISYLRGTILFFKGSIVITFIKKCYIYIQQQ